MKENPGYLQMAPPLRELIAWKEAEGYESDADDDPLAPWKEEDGFAFGEKRGQMVEFDADGYDIVAGEAVRQKTRPVDDRSSWTAGASSIPPPVAMT